MIPDPRQIGDGGGGGPPIPGESGMGPPPPIPGKSGMGMGMGGSESARALVPVADHSVLGLPDWNFFWTSCGRILTSRNFRFNF